MQCGAVRYGAMQWAVALHLHLHLYLHRHLYCTCTRETYGLCQRARPSSVLSCPSGPRRRAVRPEFSAGWTLGSCRPCYSGATGG